MLHKTLLFCYVSFRAEADIVRSNIDVLVSTGLGPRAEDDFLLARVTCVALLKLAKTHKVKESSDFVYLSTR